MTGEDDRGSGGGAVAEVLRSPAYRRWSVTAQLVRLPSAMLPLAFMLLATAAIGNYRLGGVMVAAATAVAVVMAAPVGRLLDRRNTLVLTSWLLIAAAVVLGLLALAGALSLPGVLLVGLAVISSGLTAGAPAGMRRILSVTVPVRLLVPALAVDGIFVELTVVSGPLLVAAAAAVAAGVGGVGAMALFTGLAALLVRGLVAPPARATASAGGGGHARGPRLWSPAFALWFFVGVAAGQGIGVVEVSALPLARQVGGGTVLAVALQVSCVWRAQCRGSSTPLAATGYPAAPSSVGRFCLSVLVSVWWCWPASRASPRWWPATCWWACAPPR
ncbi:hypothetical protein [Pseudonocardia endophytica]|uniref:hypothetical protein n=1 Tax=Pseudonocardia endophytica TaxID=401976 RepID=UPI001050FC29|nr:hypothetical protein [Pseudonocardia endophytica]